jgi:DNA helicase II / ATP-dependent DNA helicase PcrA
MDFSKLLNEHQIQAVISKEQYLRIIAGAGSGKTRVLTFRIAHLIGERKVEPHKILAITFTNKVAGEMRFRALKLVPEAKDDLKVMTFHSFCARFLRREITTIGYPASFTIFDEDDQERLVKSIAVDEGFRKNDDIVKKTINYIDKHKCIGEYPEKITINKEKFPGEKECLRLYHIYQKRLVQMYALDFDDLLLKTIEILKKFSDIRNKWQNRIDHVLIDEFQDTNDVQYDLVKLLLKPTTSLYVVGDPDQTIYTWRGANQNIILDIDKKYNMKTIILDRNYRSTQTILNTANKLIDHNRLRVKKDLYSKNGEGQEIAVHRALRQIDEAEWVVNEILQMKREEKFFKYRHVAILYRANYLTLPFEKELNRMQIPYRIFGGMRFYQRKEIKDVLAYFRLIINKRDDISFLRIINVPRRGIGDKTVQILKNEAMEADLSIYEYLEQITDFNTRLKTKSIMAIDTMLKIIDQYRLRLFENLEAFSDILKQYLIELGYYDDLKDDDNEGRLENVDSLFDDILSYIKENPASGFEEYLQNVSLTTSQDEVTEGDFISLMTVHTAKGLEFKNVFVIGLNEGIFPSLKTMAEDAYLGLEEERRLCYVAFTRAKKRLYLSCSGDYSYIINGRLLPSRFFIESGIDFSRRLPTSELPAFKTQISSLFRRSEPKVKESDIHDWIIGDKIMHNVFGLGEVIEVIDNMIIEVDFDSCGKKKLIANHPAIKRIEHHAGGMA